jgi:hypothetical protein
MALEYSGVEWLFAAAGSVRQHYAQRSAWERFALAVSAYFEPQEGQAVETATLECR